MSIYPLFIVCDLCADVRVGREISWEVWAEQDEGAVARNNSAADGVMCQCHGSIEIKAWAFMQHRATTVNGK